MSSGSSFIYPHRCLLSGDPLSADSLAIEPASSSKFMRICLESLDIAEVAYLCRSISAQGAGVLLISLASLNALQVVLLATRGRSVGPN
jgi:hypothetical protein